MLARGAVGGMRKCGGVSYGYQALSKAVGENSQSIRKKKVIDTPSSILAFSSVYLSLLFLARGWHGINGCFSMSSPVSLLPLPFQHSSR